MKKASIITTGRAESPMSGPTRRWLPLLAGVLLCTACGGGGGGGGSEPPPPPPTPPPPPPPASTTFSAVLTAIDLEDIVTGQTLDTGGLPVRGATITRE